MVQGAGQTIERLSDDACTQSNDNKHCQPQRSLLRCNIAISKVT